ncbi:hypothetical protein Rhow_007317 [Rhodococcus wratislaviensis]|uniref:Uncharacterized protein n=1 Tax=Rhodococcus wratislaviensis TaxID=44752 RepID=A0A402CHW7_RHOWR|nr:hypothetical protein Rhow_007317 [Rhodococcus wratislaviensis]
MPVDRQLPSSRCGHARLPPPIHTYCAPRGRFAGRIATRQAR